MARKSNDKTDTNASADCEYKVGPGRPPREYQFKPGQSGNPKGATPKPPSLMFDLKKIFERGLQSKGDGDARAGVQRVIDQCGAAGNAAACQPVCQRATGTRGAMRSGSPKDLGPNF